MLLENNLVYNVRDGTQPAVYYLDNVHLSSDIGGGQPADARAKR